MSIIVDENTRLLIQGITGREASEKLPEMLEYGTEVLAGVTPGKGGQEVEGIPVYDTVEKAVEKHPGINTSLVYVPPFAAKEATFEALESGIKTLNIVTENIPIRDTWEISVKADKMNAEVVGPTSVGILTPSEAKVGPIGGSSPGEVYSKGSIGIVSKSGGMTTETANVIRKAGYGVSTAVDIGGDRIVGTDYVDIIKLFEKDPGTKAIVMFGELGGTYENKVAEYVKNENSQKPIIAFIAGKFTERLPSRQYGHAGAIIKEEREKPSYKENVLRDAGVNVVDVHHKIGDRIKDVL